MIIVNPALVSQNTGVDIEVRVTVGDKEYDGISVGDKEVGISVGDKEVRISVGEKEYDGISVGDKVVGDKEYVGISVGDNVVGIRVGDKVVGDCDG